MRVFTFLLLGVTGCVQEAASLEEGCADELDGASLLGDVSTDLLERVNCYRGYLGLRAIEVTPRVQRAAQNHMDYLALHDVLADGSEDPRDSRQELLGEALTLEGATGAEPFDRNEHTGAISSTDARSRGQVWGWFLHDAAVDGDALIANPYLRDMFFQPVVVGVGHAEGVVGGTPRGYVDVVATIPSGVRTARPVVYPKDGQTDVPTIWQDPWAREGEMFGRETPYGYPVTVTFSASEAGGGAYNPFDVKLLTASLTPEGGEPVKATVIVPQLIQVVALRTTVGIVPEQPLALDTTYRVEVEVETSLEAFQVETTFTTSAAGGE